MALGIAGMALGWTISSRGLGLLTDHKAIGLTVVVAALVQVLFGMLRVQKGRRWRLQWSWAHRWALPRP